MAEEKVIAPFDDVVVDQSAIDLSKFAEAVKKFNEQFAKRSFSKRHEELGKMIDCRLCGHRHRTGDTLVLASRAHGEQKEVNPSRSVIFKKQRFHPHHNSRTRLFADLAAKIYNEDIAPYFSPDPKLPDNLIRRAQRRAALILKKRWIAARVIKKHMQSVSRRINWSLLPGGSR
jgi:hypothetical protein